MEKMKWTRPETTGEMFEANEYVAACITGLIQCAYPGDGQTNGQIDKFDDYNGKKVAIGQTTKACCMVFVATMRKFLSVKIPEVVLNILVIRFSETVLFTVSKIITQPSVRITV